METVREEKKQADVKEYYQAIGGLVLAFGLMLLVTLPIIFLVVGFAVRCFRWAAGYQPFF